MKCARARGERGGSVNGYCRQHADQRGRRSCFMYDIVPMVVALKRAHSSHGNNGIHADFFSFRVYIEGATTQQRRARVSHRTVPRVSNPACARGGGGVVHLQALSFHPWRPLSSSSRPGASEPSPERYPLYPGRTGTWQRKHWIRHEPTSQCRGVGQTDTRQQHEKNHQGHCESRTSSTFMMDGHRRFCAVFSQPDKLPRYNSEHYYSTAHNGMDSV